MSPALLLLVLFLFAAFLAAARKGLFTKGRAGQGMTTGPSSRRKS